MQAIDGAIPQEIESASTADNSPSRGAQILAALDGRIEPVRASLMYRLATVVVAAAMLVLPAIYLGLIGLVAFAIYWHATNDLSLLKAQDNAWFRAIAYAAPIIVGTVLIVFMIKPLFARNMNQSPPMLIERGEDPLLYAYVDRLCEAVGCRKPRRIYVDCEVNAAAGFGRGYFGWIFGRLDLYLGLPLFAALDLRQMSGVMAHEMGHFSQGSAMRLGYVVRSINIWFVRVIYQRDKWDRALYRWSHRRQMLWTRLLGMLSELAVKFVRRILRFLLIAGHAMSCFLLRQQEFDADKHGARLVGAKPFEQETNRIAVLALAYHGAHMELGVAWRERRLADDLPLFIKSREAALPQEAKDKLLKALAERKSRWFDTHPSHSQRIQRVRKENPPGIFGIEAPASILFRDFKETCRRATILHYQKFLGKNLKPEHLVETADISTDHDVRKEKQLARRRYFQDLLSPARALYPDSAEGLPQNPADVSKFIRQARAALLSRAESARAAAKAFDQGVENVMRSVHVRSLLEAGATIKPEAFKLRSGDFGELEALERGGREMMRKARQALDPLIRAQLQRMQMALGTITEQVPAIVAEDSESEEEIALADATENPRERIRRAMRVMALANEPMRRLADRLAELNAVVPLVRREGNSATLGRQVLGSCKRTNDALLELHQVLATGSYPYEHNRGNVNLSQFCCGKLPEPKKFRLVLSAARATLAAAAALHNRMLADLAEEAEKAEANMGLEPLKIGETESQVENPGATG